MSVVKVSAKAKTTKLIHQIELYRRRLETAMKRTVQMVSETVAQAARDIYGHAVDVVVEPVTDEAFGWLWSCVISANGQAVVFLEFGAGDLTDESHPYAETVPVYIKAGSWSASDDGTGEYVFTGQWHWHGQTFTGVMPRRALYNAVLTAMTKTEQISRQQFVRAGRGRK